MTRSFIKAPLISDDNFFRGQHYTTTSIITVSNFVAPITLATIEEVRLDSENTGFPAKFVDDDNSRLPAYMEEISS